MKRPAIFKKGHHHKDKDKDKDATPVGAGGSDFVPLEDFLQLQSELSEVRTDWDDVSENLELARITARNIEDQYRAEQAAHGLLAATLAACEAKSAELEADSRTLLEEESKQAEAAEQAAEASANEAGTLRTELAKVREAEQQLRVMGAAQRSQGDQLRKELASSERASAEVKASAAASQEEALAALRTELDEARGASRREEAQVASLIKARQEESGAALEKERGAEEALRAELRDAEAEALRQRQRAVSEQQAQLQEVTSANAAASAASLERARCLEEVKEREVAAAEIQRRLSDAELQSQAALERVQGLEGELRASACEAAELQQQLSEEERKRLEAQQISGGEASAAALERSGGEEEEAQQISRSEASAAAPERPGGEEEASRMPLDAGAHTQLQKLEEEIRHRDEALSALRSELSAAHAGQDAAEPCLPLPPASGGDGGSDRSAGAEDGARPAQLQAELLDAEELIAQLRAELRESAGAEVASPGRAEEAVADVEARCARAEEEAEELSKALEEVRQQREATLRDAEDLRHSLAEVVDEREEARIEALNLQGRLLQATQDRELAALGQAAGETKPGASGEASDGGEGEGSEQGDTAAAASAVWPAERSAGLELAAELVAAERESRALRSELASSKDETEASDKLIAETRAELESAGRAQDEMALAVESALAEAARSAAAEAGAQAGAQEAMLHEDSSNFEELEAELAREREHHIKAAGAAQSAWESCSELRSEVAEVDALKEELEQERGNHISAASAAEIAWARHSELREESLILEGSLADGEAERAAECAELMREIGAAREDLAEKVASAAAAAEVSEASADELRQALALAEESAAAGARAETERVDVQAEGDLRAALAAAEQAESKASEERQALEQHLVEAQAEQASLRDELDAAEYGLRITSEVAAEDGGGEPIGLAEARRWRQECRALEQQLAASDAADTTSHGSTAPFDPTKTANFGSESEDACLPLRGSTPSFAIASGGSLSEEVGRCRSFGRDGGRSSAAHDFAPPTRSPAISRGGSCSLETVMGSPAVCKPLDEEDVVGPLPSAGHHELRPSGNPFGPEAEDDPKRELCFTLGHGGGHQDMLRAAASSASPRGVSVDAPRSAQSSSQPPIMGGPLPTFGDEGFSSGDVAGCGSAAAAGELARLRAALATEGVACAEAQEEARGAKRALAESRSSSLGGGAVGGAASGGAGGATPLHQELEQLRQALSEEAAKSRRLGEHALRAEEGRRRLLHELAEDAEAEADLAALAKVVGRAAKAIAVVSREAPVNFRPAEDAASPSPPSAPATPAAAVGAHARHVPPARLPAVPPLRAVAAADLM